MAGISFVLPSTVPFSSQQTALGETDNLTITSHQPSCSELLAMKANSTPGASDMTSVYTSEGPARQMELFSRCSRAPVGVRVVIGVTVGVLVTVGVPVTVGGIVIVLKAIMPFVLIAIC